MNQFMMGMLAIAAATFASCSNDDATGSATSRNDVGNFYMKLQVTGSNNGTRTTGPKTDDGTAEESTIKTGTIWLVNEAGEVKFSKHITAADWDGTNNTTTNPIKVAVTQVVEDTPYKVYFLANKEGALKPSPTLQELTSSTGGADYATANSFVMFNQNDKSAKANQYVVTFTADNRDASNPATPSSAIKLDRVTARLDYPTTATTINKAAAKNEKTRNIEAIKSLNLQGFAPFNVANKENMEQKWDNNWTVMQLPNDLGELYYPKAKFGDGRNTTATYPDSWLTDKTYVFENIQSDADKATGIFLKYKATAETTANKDFADGTFYRYDEHVFTSIQDIIDFAGAANPFGSLTAAQVVDLIKGEPTEADPTKFNLTTDASKLEKFRKDYNIEVFERGEVYYGYFIEDTYHTGMKYSVLRNSIYRINVESIFDLGSDTPNPPVIQPNYYLNVKVTVNPWILNTININLE